MSESSNETEIILVSGDHEEFRIPIKIANLSAMIANIISEDDTEEQRIPLPNVRREILAKVLEFCNHYSEEKMTEFVKVFLYQ
jgi:hypothetical protein